MSFGIIQNNFGHPVLLFFIIGIFGPFFGLLFVYCIVKKRSNCVLTMAALAVELRKKRETKAHK